MAVESGDLVSKFYLRIGKISKGGMSEREG